MEFPIPETKNMWKDVSDYLLSHKEAELILEMSSDSNVDEVESKLNELGITVVDIIPDICPAFVIEITKDQLDKLKLVAGIREVYVNNVCTTIA